MGNFNYNDRTCDNCGTKYREHYSHGVDKALGDLWFGNNFCSNSCERSYLLAQEAKRKAEKAVKDAEKDAEKEKWKSNSDSSYSTYTPSSYTSSYTYTQLTPEEEAWSVVRSAVKVIEEYVILKTSKPSKLAIFKSIILGCIFFIPTYLLMRFGLSETGVTGNGYQLTFFLMDLGLSEYVIWENDDKLFSIFISSLFSFFIILFRYKSTEPPYSITAQFFQMIIIMLPILFVMAIIKIFLHGSAYIYITISALITLYIIFDDMKRTFLCQQAAKAKMELRGDGRSEYFKSLLKDRINSEIAYLKDRINSEIAYNEKKSSIVARVMVDELKNLNTTLNVKEKVEKMNNSNTTKFNNTENKSSKIDSTQTSEKIVNVNSNIHDTSLSNTSKTSDESINTLAVEAVVNGNVWKILVNVGDKVEKGQVVAILEAMMMEINIEAPASGTISSIDVGLEDALSEGQKIATIITDNNLTNIQNHLLKKEKIEKYEKTIEDYKKNKSSDNTVFYFAGALIIAMIGIMIYRGSIFG